MVGRAMSIGLGIFGAGGAAGLHADAAAGGGLNLRAICDVDLDKARLLAARYANVQVVASMDELLADDDIAAVVVATPNAFHKDLAIAAMRAGKDVLLEKPMAMNVGECDEIIAARDELQRLLQLGFVCRGAPAALAARELVGAGRLGEIYHAKASVYRRRGIPGLGRWFTTKARSGGGVLVDLGVHVVDLVLHLTGYPGATRVSAVCTSTFGSPIDAYAYEEMWGGPPDPEGVFDVEDAATALIRFETGLAVEINVTWAADLSEERMRSQIVLLGDRGGCCIDLWGNELILTTEQDGEIADLRQELPDVDAWSSAWTRQAATFAGNIEHRRPPEASGENGRTVQALLGAIYRSAAEGREVGLGSELE
jgi:predicted dehydrogenase